jgi:hypothetical protein
MKDDKRCLALKSAEEAKRNRICESGFSKKRDSSPENLLQYLVNICHACKWEKVGRKVVVVVVHEMKLKSPVKMRHHGTGWSYKTV